ncbi:MAG: hypothetical protein KC464_20575, partial [Myxococcales bacterium]|nr:hypothetical protein [Myxococcales bacterium]
PVTGLAAVASDAGVDVSWTNPTDGDLAGVLVVVGDATITFAPVDGTAYAVDQDLGGGVRVLHVDATEATAIAPAVIGAAYQVAAWAYDDAGQFSAIATTTGRHDALGAQTGTISVDLTTQVVTVVQQPADLTLAGTAVYDDASDSLVIDLTVQNDTARLLFNLKGLSTAINEGGQSAPLFPAVGGVPYTYYGPEALDVGGTMTRQLALTGITGGTDPITVDLTFVDAPMIYTGATYGALEFVDSSGSGQADFVELGVTQSPRQGAMSPDGRFIYTGRKEASAVYAVDTTTLTAVAGAALGGGALSSVGGVALTPGGDRLLVAINDGAHWNNGADGEAGPASGDAGIELVEVAPAGLTEVQRVTLTTADGLGRVAHEVQVSPDGALAVVLVTRPGAGATGVSEVWLVDLATFAVIDADGATAGDQPVPMASVGQADHAIFFAGKLYVTFNQYRFGDANVAVSVDVVDPVAHTVTTVTPVGGGSWSGMPVATADRLYYSTRRGPVTAPVTVFTAAGDQHQVAGFTDVHAIALAPDGARYYVFDGNGGRCWIMDATTDLPIDTDGDAGNGATPIASNFEVVGSHLVLTSPF